MLFFPDIVLSPIRSDFAAHHSATCATPRAVPKVVSVEHCRCVCQGTFREVAFVSSQALTGTGRRLRRALSFWGQVFYIWATFKYTQVRVSLFRSFRSEQWVTNVWHRQHILAGDLMWRMCSNLRAFYAKAGQLVAMQGFVPNIIREKLSRLQDDMPPLSGTVARELIEKELKKRDQSYSVERVFQSIELDTVLGCASIAQVHRAVLRDGNLPVAVKVQLPDAELLMGSDLSNFRLLAKVLQRTELRFDLEGPVNELTQQLNAEFDFRIEARSMHVIREMLKRVRGVRVPKPVNSLVTRKLLVMEYLDGLPLTRMNRRVTGKRALKFAGRRIVGRMSKAYGEMILTHGFFQADSHPGNVLILNKKLDIGILDFGQTKVLSDASRLAFAHLVDAMARRQGEEIAKAMSALGIIIEPVKQRSRTRRGRKQKQSGLRTSTVASVGAGKPAEQVAGSVAGSSSALVAAPSRPQRKLTESEKLAYTMFDTAEYAGVSSNPFSDQSALRTATVKELPQELFFLLRTVQIIRGICAATGNPEYSMAQAWASIAQRALHAAKQGKAS